MESKAKAKAKAKADEDEGEDEDKARVREGERERETEREMRRKRKQNGNRLSSSPLAFSRPPPVFNVCKSPPATMRERQSQVRTRDIIAYQPPYPSPPPPRKKHRIMIF